MKIKVWESHKYVEVFNIVSKYPTGEVKSVKSIGFALETRKKKENEEYAPISTSMLTKGTEMIELSPMLD